ncbi:MAG: alpha-1,2-fucosyltransferase [Ignavibacteria bacterium]|jgi:hypothetical protein|nr:alpha-1,2-fucosyltransferase [Ignavibacteria bacterium]
MIICRLKGGLGNQLFQYAIARRLSKKCNCDFKLDISAFQNDNFGRDYMLGKFNVIQNIVTSEELRTINLWFSNSCKGKLLRCGSKVLPYYRRYIVNETRPYFYDQNILKIRNNSCLNGYWQNENYFKEIRDILLKEFVVVSKLRGKNKDLADDINKTNSVGIHIRRHKGIQSNSVLYKKVVSQYGLVSNEYYNRAVDIIANKQSNIEVFVFSDDIEWAKANLNFTYPITFVDNNDEANGYEDFRLLSLCKHQIIANSTFSWWAAWLNNYHDKVIISPNKWVQSLLNIPNGIYPDNWLLLNN